MPKGVYKRAPKFKHKQLSVPFTFADKLEEAGKQTDKVMAEYLMNKDRTNEEVLQEKVKQLETELLRIYRKLYCSVCDEY